MHELALITTGDDRRVTMTSAEIDQFLEMVKQTFSDVLFPIEYITQQDFLGQGNVLNEVAIVIACVMIKFDGPCYVQELLVLYTRVTLLTQMDQ